MNGLVALPARPGKQAPEPSSPPDLPGMGPALWEKVLSAMRPTEFARALADGDVERLETVEGISARRAIEWMTAGRPGFDDHDLAKTGPAQKLLADLRERIANYACTRTGRNRLRLLRFLPSPEACSAHAREIMEAAATLGGLDRRAIVQALRHLRPLASATPRFDPTLAIVYENDEVWDTLHAWGAGKWASLVSRRDVEHAQEHERVIAVFQEGFDTSAVPQAVEVDITDGLHQVLPQTALQYVEDNRTSLEAASNLATILGRPNPAGLMLSAFQSAPAVPAGHDFLKIAKNIQGEASAWVIREAATVHVTGAELLAAKGGLPAPLQQVLTKALDLARDRWHAETGMRGQVLTRTLPPSVDEDELQRLITQQRTQESRVRFDAQVRVAREIELHRAAAEAQVRELLAWDRLHALASFALDMDLAPATFGGALRVEGALHLDVARDSEAQRVDYHLGNTHRLTLLTGANSGGKTTLLESLAQIVFLARLGLPVPARTAEVPWLDEVHYVTARRSLDAGAFEAFLRSFLPVTLGDARRLVLADEVESVTELESATRILAFTLDRLAQTASLAVVVSHLAPHILAHVRAPIRVDGIEATGLDENNRLVVDRQPRIGRLARSTPELIVQRLASTTRTAEQRLYTDLLQHLRASPAAPTSKAGK